MALLGVIPASLNELPCEKERDGEGAPRLVKMCLRSCSLTTPSLSWSMSENASRNCCTCGGWKSENTPEGSRRCRLFCAFNLAGDACGVMLGDSMRDIVVCRAAEIHSDSQRTKRGLNEEDGERCMNWFDA